MFSVSDITRAVGFYRDVLGLRCEIESAADKWAEFDCGNVTLSLNGSGSSRGAHAGGRIALAVDNVWDAYDELAKRGIKAEGTPVDYGVCVAFEVRDPDGNTVIVHKRADGSFGQNPALPTHSPDPAPVPAKPAAGQPPRRP